MTDPTPTPPLDSSRLEGPDSSSSETASTLKTPLDMATLRSTIERMDSAGILDFPTKITGNQLAALIARLENAEALHLVRHNHVLAAEEVRNQWRARAEAAEAKIAAVRELHAASPCEPDCCLLETCNECLNTYPCPTIAALDGTG